MTRAGRTCLAAVPGVLLLLLVSAPCLEAQKAVNHQFPRTGTLQWGGGTPDWLSRFDLVITVPSDKERVRATRLLNPNSYYLATWDWNAGGPFYDVTNPNSVDTAWRLRDQTGTYIPYAAQSLVDITDFCGLLDGEKYNQALPRRINQDLDWSVFDGVNSDGTWSFPSGTSGRGLDLDRNGLNDYTEPGKGYEWIRGYWQTGQNLVRQRLRALWGSSQKIITYWTVTDTMCVRIVNGGGWESALVNPPHTVDAWLGLVSQWEAFGGQNPQINWICADIFYDAGHAPARMKDYFRFMRWMLGVCLLNNTYFMIGDDGYHYYNFYYDEFDAKLGYPKGPQVRLSNGCRVRFFDQGVCIVNPTNSTLTVSSADLAGLPGYDGPYYRFTGNQDPVWNDGSQFSSVTLVSSPASGGAQYVGDGILLLKQKRTVVSDIIVDDSYSATSPGSPQGYLTGFSWDQAASTNQANPTWTTGPYWDNFPAEHRSHLAPPGSGSARAIYTPAINVPGTYKVYEWHGWPGATPGGLKGASNVPCRVVYKGGSADLVIDQTTNFGQWNLIGSFEFSGGGRDSLTITNNANGYVVADAFKFQYVPEQPAGVGGERTLPGEFRLFDNYPNPFNPSTTISYMLPQGSDVRLTVYNILGEEVWRLVAGRQEAGLQSLRWESLDNNGHQVPSGVYMYRLEASSPDGRTRYEESKRMILIR